MKENRWKHKNGFWVVHEGLQNNKDIQSKLEKISKELDEVILNEGRHLSDSALIVGLISKKLDKISKELFKRHDVEKKSGVKN